MTDSTENLVGLATGLVVLGVAAKVAGNLMGKAKKRKGERVADWNWFK
jgi:hypothetical protein